MRRTYTTDQMVFSSIGNFSVATVQRVAEEYLGSYEPTKRGYERQRVTEYKPFVVEQLRHTHQAHGIIGSRGYGITNDRRLPLALAVNILGGPSANSLRTLNLGSATAYRITSRLRIHHIRMPVLWASTSRRTMTMRSSVSSIEREVERLMREPITPRRLAIAKRQFVAQMAISMESNEGYMLGAGKSYLIYKDIDTLEEAYKKVAAITAEQIMDVTSECFAHMSRLIYK